MLIHARTIWKDNTSLVDCSQELNDLYQQSKVIPFVAAEDKIYLGSDLPFNHRYFKMTVVNALPSIVGVKIYTGNGFESVAEVFDRTAVAGSSLGKSGIIEWRIKDTQSWQRRNTDEITELSTLEIPNLYWAEISFSADLTAGTSIGYIGHRFCSDAELGGRYPDLNRASVKTAFETGKTTWEDQAITASEKIIQDLKREKHIISPSQVFGWEVFNEACIHKTAELIFSAFGEDYDDRRELAREDYDEAMNVKLYLVDKDADGRLDSFERVRSSGLIRR